MAKTKKYNVLDDKLKYLKSKYKPHDFIPLNPLIVGIWVRPRQNQAVFYFSTLYLKPSVKFKRQNLRVKHDYLALPLWQTEDRNGFKRYVCADGSTIKMFGGEDAARFFLETEKGEREISEVLAEDIITKELEQKYLYRYVKEISPELEVMGGLWNGGA